MVVVVLGGGVVVEGGGAGWCRVAAVSDLKRSMVLAALRT